MFTKLWFINQGLNWNRGFVESFPPLRSSLANSAALTFHVLYTLKHQWVNEEAWKNEECCKVQTCGNTFNRQRFVSLIIVNGQTLDNFLDGILLHGDKPRTIHFSVKQTHAIKTASEWTFMTRAPECTWESARYSPSDSPRALSSAALQPENGSRQSKELFRRLLCLISPYFLCFLRGEWLSPGKSKCVSMQFIYAIRYTVHIIQLNTEGQRLALQTLNNDRFAYGFKAM